MADKTISELVAATSVGSTDLFVLEQSNTAKKLTGQILENWLVSFADGHGGIQSIAKTGTSGTNPVIDTYTITLADTTTFSFTVTNGLKGDTGAQTYVWIKWAAQNPTADNQLSDNPDAWIGIYSGTASTAPTTRASYQWYEYKGDTGATGATGASIASIVRTSGDGSPGTTDTYTITLDTGVVAGTFNVYNGLNGTGAVATVNGITPDVDGNVSLTGSDIGVNPSTSAPLVDVGSGVVGTSTDFARGDHRHPLNVSGSAPSPLGTAAAGSSAQYSRADHVHAMPSADDVGAMSTWELLWENASPNSNFGGQTLSIDVSGYDALYLYVKQDTNTAPIATGIWLFKKNADFYLRSVVNGVFSLRGVYVPSDYSSVVFNSGYYQGGYANTNLTVSNNALIPTHIYGIKGVD